MALIVLESEKQVSASEVIAKICEQQLERMMRIMSAHQQVEPGSFRVGNWTAQPPTAVSVGTQIHKSARKLSLAAIFARSIEERSIADGNLFSRFLSMERKRAERSGNSFLLVELRLKDMFNGQDERKMLASLHGGIFSAIRNTDFVGWHEGNQPALGILFTEIVDPNQVVAATILKRMKEGLSAHTAPGLVKKIDVTCHVFQGGGSNDSRSIARNATAAD